MTVQRLLRPPVVVALMCYFVDSVIKFYIFFMSSVNRPAMNVVCMHIFWIVFFKVFLYDRSTSSQTSSGRGFNVTCFISLTVLLTFISSL